MRSPQPPPRRRPPLPPRLRRLSRKAGRRVGRLLLAGLGLALGLPPLLTLVHAALPVPLTPLMLIRLAEGEGLTRTWVPLDAIAPALPRAVIAAEDNLFCRHRGFDIKAMTQAVAAYRRGGRSPGASTLSMQTAKNLMLPPDRSLIRKGLEAYATQWIETAWSKRRILEVYLNVAEWGPGIYGAEAAARHHFGKPARDLSGREAALLAATLPNPRRWAAGKPSPHISGRATVIARRVGQLGPLLDCAP